VSRLRGSAGAAAALLVLAAAVGAAVGALLRPSPANPYAADSVISIQPDVPPAPDEVARQRGRWERASEALTLPQVMTRASALTHLPVAFLRARLSARGNSDSALFVIRARGVSEKQAVAIASAATNATIEFLRVTSGNPGAGSSRSSFDFEGSAQDWGLGHSLFLLPPASTAATTGSGHAGRGFLRTRCTTRRAGCGTWVSVARAFSPGKVYSAAAWVRAPRGRVPLRVGFGSSPEDVADGKTVQVSSAWKRITVKWTPRSLVGSSEVHVQVNGPGPATFDTDDAVVRGPGGRLPSSQGLDIPDRYSLVGPPQASSKLRSDTATAALIGGAISLAAAGGGLALGWVARRRRHQAEQ
jgi:hypothetical protein